MERITSAQPPPCMAKHPSLEILDMQGMDFPLFVYKPRRGAKRGEDCKETYKLPHRLIEKKRRDRINECIAQLKDLLPEHLKLTTLGHLEKAVVLELTLKHVKALTVLLEQHQQKILALQSGIQSVELSPHSQESGEEIFRSGFEMCAKEVLQYLAHQESGQDLTPAHMISHLRKVVPEVLQTTPGTRAEELCRKKGPAGPIPEPGTEGRGKNCVPVIQRTYPQGGSELSGSDTDTDSGYGGELEKRHSKAQRPGYCDKDGERGMCTIKRESEEPHAKRPRAESSEDESLSSGEMLSGYTGFPPQHPPLCVPFYLLPPGTAYLPTMLEKHWYPRCMPVLYPGMGGSALATSPDKHPPSLAPSPRVSSPVAPPFPMDSPVLLQVLKQVPPLNLESKD